MKTYSGTVAPDNQYKIVNEGKTLEYELQTKDVLKDKTVEFRYGTLERLYNKVKRNDPCPCGSGKKSKKCCFK